MHIVFTFFASTFLLLTPFSAKAELCPFQDLSIHELSAPRYTKTSDTLIKPPLSLVKSFAASEDLAKCPSLRFVQIKETQSGKTYTLLISHDAVCDGGNTFGLLLQGNRLSSSAVIGFVEDSYLQCL